MGEAYAEVIDQRLGAGSIDIDDDHIRALADQSFHHTVADQGGAAGDQSRTPREVGGIVAGDVHGNRTLDRSRAADYPKYVQRRIQ